MAAAALCMVAPALLGLTAFVAAPFLLALALSLTNFRNYRFAQLDLTAAPAVLFGDNGAGKTNLLEAISLLTLSQDQIFCYGK